MELSVEATIIISLCIENAELLILKDNEIDLQYWWSSKSLMCPFDYAADAENRQVGHVNRLTTPAE